MDLTNQTPAVVLLLGFGLGRLSSYIATVEFPFKSNVSVWASFQVHLFFWLAFYIYWIKIPANILIEVNVGEI